MPRVERFMGNVRSEFENLLALRVAGYELWVRKQKTENGKKLIT